jgi:hypothetical protein
MGSSTSIETEYNTKGGHRYMKWCSPFLISRGNKMSLDTDYFYKMSAPVRVLASTITDRMGRVHEEPSHVGSRMMPYGLDKEELIVYAHQEFGLLLSRKMSIGTMVQKVYEAGSDEDQSMAGW